MGYVNLNRLTIAWGEQLHDLQECISYLENASVLLFANENIANPYQ